jgi:hypothetical protein
LKQHELNKIVGVNAEKSHRMGSAAVSPRSGLTGARRTPRARGCAARGGGFETAVN